MIALPSFPHRLPGATTPIPHHTLLQGDALSLLRTLPDASVDLVIGSPPYEAARTYGSEVNFRLRGTAYLDWAMPIYEECLRVSRGLVAWVIAGQTRAYAYSAVPERLMARLIDAGYAVRRPPIYRRFGIPGSGGPDWLRCDYEPIVCATRVRGCLPWSDNTAMGHPPKHPPGGACSNRHVDGRRINRPMQGNKFTPPTRSNPGNILDCGAVGGGHMGHDLAHHNEAPYPLRVPEFFIRSFCPPGGLVLDPFAGSGTTAHAALITGRHSLGFDLRSSQIELASRRLRAVAAEASGMEPASGIRHPASGEDADPQPSSNP